MAMPGLLIEYLVTGAIAFAWLFQLLPAELRRTDPALLPVVFLLLYVLGMVVDYAAWAITRAPKQWLRSRVYRKYRGPAAVETQSGTFRQAWIALYAPDLAKELAMRSSRDRVARGAVVNAILATVFVLPWKLGLSLTLIAVVLWYGFETLSYGYELCAEAAIKEKLQREAGVASPTTR